MQSHPWRPRKPSVLPSHSANRSLHERCGDIIAVLRSGAAVDAALADVYAGGIQRHDGMRWAITT
jgi:hypothetical protein